MTLWVVLRSPHNLRFVVPILERLRDRGHRLVVSFALPGEGDESESLAWARERLPDAEFGLLGVDRGRGRLPRLLPAARDLRSYLAQARLWTPMLRSRWRAFLPRPLRWIVRPQGSPPWPRVLPAGLLRRALAWLERRVPPPPDVVAQLHDVGADLVFVSPLVYPGSSEIDAVKAAAGAGVPSVGMVLSWDNLSSKGCFHAFPDELLVWNDVQREEALTMHAFPRPVRAVGAPVFDYLFEEQEALARERGEFLGELGLAADARYLLYAVTSRVGLGPGGEVPIVRRLAAALRERWPRDGRPPAIVVRPHPRNRGGWEALEEPDVVVWRRPGFPDSERARSDLVSSIVHAELVAGLSTSMFLEAAVLERPCMAILLRSGRFAQVAPSTLTHFRYLMDAGFLHAVEDEQAAAAEVERILRAGDDREESRRRFVRDFLRPEGLDRAAADVAADRLVALARP